MVNTHHACPSCGARRTVYLVHIYDLRLVELAFPYLILNHCVSRYVEQELGETISFMGQLQVLSEVLLLL